MSKSKKIILWDVDGVLVWHHPDDPTLDWRKALVENDWLPIWEMFQKTHLWQQCLTNPEEDVFLVFSSFLKEKNLNDTIAPKIINHWLESNIVANQDALDCLERLVAENCVCGIASNQDARRAVKIMSWLRLKGFADIPLYISCDIRVAKPQSNFYKYIERQHPDFRHFVLLDDTRDNVEAAIVAGWESHQVTPDFSWDELYKAITTT